jgi:hypothetical protein
MEYVDEFLLYETDEEIMKVWPKYTPELKLNAIFAVCDGCEGHGKKKEIKVF